MNQEQIEGGLKALLKQAVEETGADLATGVDELAVFIAQRTVHLSTLAGDPGFEIAVQAERNIVAMRAGLVAHGRAKQADVRLLGIIQGAISMGARALVAAV